MPFTAQRQSLCICRLRSWTGLCISNVFHKEENIFAEERLVPELAYSSEIYLLADNLF